MILIYIMNIYIHIYTCSSFSSCLSQSPWWRACCCLNGGLLLNNGLVLNYILICIEKPISRPRYRSRESSRYVTSNKIPSIYLSMCISTYPSIYLPIHPDAVATSSSLSGLCPKDRINDQCRWLLAYFALSLI